MLRGVLWGRGRTGSWLGENLAGWARPGGSHKRFNLVLGQFGGGWELGSTGVTLQVQANLGA